jgi:hypothetical protein
MREDQIDQAERRKILDNDLKVLQQQGSTFHQHAMAHADELSQGRFAATGAPRVIGSTPTSASQYPSASAAHQTELPPEEPLGYCVDEIPERENLTGVLAGGPAHAPSGGSGPACPSRDLVSERAGSSPFFESETEKDDGNDAA